jgi:hypothetical protein
MSSGARAQRQQCARSPFRQSREVPRGLAKTLWREPGEAEKFRGRRRKLFRNAPSRRGIVPSWKPQPTTENSRRSVAASRDGQWMNSTRSPWSRWPKSGYGWPSRPSKSGRETPPSVNHSSREIYCHAVRCRQRDATTPAPFAALQLWSERRPCCGRSPDTAPQTSGTARRAPSGPLPIPLREMQRSRTPERSSTPCRRAPTSHRVDVRGAVPEPERSSAAKLARIVERRHNA